MTARVPWAPPLSADEDLRARRVARFLAHEAYLLDHFAFDQWLDLYTDDATYWVPLDANQADPFDTHSLMYDDKRLMQVRVRQQSHPRAHARLPLTRTVHQIGNVLVRGAADADEVEVNSTLVLFEYRNERQRSFAATVVHRLLPWEGEYKIRLKRVDLINSESELDGIAFLF